MTVNANDIKKRGVSIFEPILKESDEVIINVRGKDKYVVLDINRYNELRENELDLAYLKVMQDIESKNYKIQSAKEHIAEIKAELQNEL